MLELNGIKVFNIQLVCNYQQHKIQVKTLFHCSSPYAFGLKQSAVQAVFELPLQTIWWFKGYHLMTWLITAVWNLLKYVMHG